MEIISPKNQLNLFGYDDYFHYFAQLYKKSKIPNVTLLSGSKGLGKSTFAYHFINYILSKNEGAGYSTSDLSININNSSYTLLNMNTHPNFFLVENNELEKDIKIDQVRNLLKFLSRSTYKENKKIVMIDNAECLNLNSSNALLNAIEEPAKNTFFFIIHNSSFKILDTIKSRCTEFKIYFSAVEKKKIFKNIIQQYKMNLDKNEILDNLYFDTPGNLIKYFSILDKANIDLNKDKLSCILYFIELYKKEKSPETLTFISLFIEIFYNELCFTNINNLNNYSFNKSKILRQISYMKRFNLYEKNILIWIRNVIENETR